MSNETRDTEPGYREVFDVSDEQAQEHQDAIDRYAEQLCEREREAREAARQYLIGGKARDTGSPEPYHHPERCVPLCGATKAYGPRVKRWQHSPLCAAVDPSTGPQDRVIPDTQQTEEETHD